MDRLQKDLYDPENMDIKIPEKCTKYVTMESNRNLESMIKSRWTNQNRGENSNWRLPGRLILTTTICDSNETTQVYTHEWHRKLNIYKITGNDKPFCLFGWYQDICKKWKSTWNPDTNYKNIQLGYRNGIWHWKMWHANNEKWGRKKKE